MENRKIEYIVTAVKWFDRVNGNTYHSCRVIRCSDCAVCVAQFQYGYGNQYQQSAIESMVESGWIDAKYKENPFMFERENGYCINWLEIKGLKRDCVKNGQL